MVTVFDIVRICKFLKIEPRKFIKDFCECLTLREIVSKSPYKTLKIYVNIIENLLKPRIVSLLEKTIFIRFKLIDDHCIFLNNDNSCKIHPVKPMVCRVFPLKPYTSILEGRLRIAEACPLSKHPELLRKEFEYFRIYVQECKTHLLVVLGLDFEEVLRLIEYLMKIHDELCKDVWGGAQSASTH